MRACQWLVSLLLVITGLVPCAGATPAPTIVGRIAEMAPKVFGGTPGSQLPQLANQAKVLLGMEVQTQIRAGATIEIFGAPPRPGKAVPPGVVRMGEKSRLIFNDWVVLRASPALGMKALLGQFLVVLLPPPRGQAAGQVEIEMPDGTKLEIGGTAVYLSVAPDGTTRVVVREGSVTVEGAAGGQVSVPQGSEVTLVPGRRPPQPTPLRPSLPVIGPVWPVEAPLRLDYPRLEQALELPKARHP